ncbi:MAG: lipid-binding SYLF domain-containing protein [Acidobacteria bacterium]|nr:lipid-binding SYLF domain-containing protein [Acidobacteriota bacterium]
MTGQRLFSVLVLLLSPLVARAGEVEDRVVRSAIVLREVMEIREKGIPQDLIDKAACVIVIPGMLKGGFMVAGTYGKGVMSCRVDAGEGPWSAPSMTMIGGGSFGLQLGGQATDLVLLVMNMRGMRSLLDSRFTLGADASVAAGPVGRTTSAETDAWMSAEILAWSRSRGLFGGIAVKGSVVRPDNDANRALYGKEISARDLLYYRTENPPRDAKILIDELTKISPTRKTK